jgi:NHL repeat
LNLRRSSLLPALLAAALIATAVLAGTATAAEVGSGEGTGEYGTVSGTVPLRGMNVVLFEATASGKRPVPLGSARSESGGRFTLHYSGAENASVKYLLATRAGGGAEAGFPIYGQSYRLGAVIGEGAVPRPAKVKITERTTVAMGFSMAQFISVGESAGAPLVAGKNPGLRNAAAMSGDLVDLGGGLSPVLRKFPNGGSTSTLSTFDTLADLLALCREQDARCARFLRLAGEPGSHVPAIDTLEAVATIARYPWHDAAGLANLARVAPPQWSPVLAAAEAPHAWTLALRFEGTPPGLDGPGNFAIDAGGNLWVANNYAYSRESRVPACGSGKLFRFTPTGQTYPGSPYLGGGLSGIGFGVTIDPESRVWGGNFGFEGKGCKTPANHYTASTFSSSGKALSPPGGWEVGGISWPQGTISDQKGDIWLANCGNDSVTKLIPGGGLRSGEPPAAVNFGEGLITAGSSVGFSRPFGDAVDANGAIFVTGNSSDSVAKLGPNGEVLSLVTGGGLHLPLGIAGDTNGYMWVSNSKWVIAPCPGGQAVSGPGDGGGGGDDVTLIKPNGKVAQGDPIEGAGLNNPWGIAVDADDNVWVANFGGQRLSELCGTEPRNCPPGKRATGDAISPASGYGFDGLVRNTGVAIDPSGNVWLANNWKNVPVQTNPGGYQIVAYLGLAAPTAAPQIGPPQHP